MSYNNASMEVEGVVHACYCCGLLGRKKQGVPP